MEGRFTTDFCLINLKVLVDEALEMAANGRVPGKLASKLKEIAQYSLKAYEKHTGDDLVERFAAEKQQAAYTAMRASDAFYEQAALQKKINL